MQTTDGPRFRKTTKNNDVVNNEPLLTIAEEKPPSTDSETCQGIVAWTLTVALVIYLTCSATDPAIGLLFTPPPSPAPQTSVPFTVMDFLRKVLSMPNYE